MAVFKTALIAVLCVLFKRRLSVSAELCGWTLEGGFGLYVIPKLIPLRVPYSLTYVIGRGFCLKLGGGKPIFLKKRKKRRRRIRIMRALRPEKLCSRGTIGVEGRPDLSVICAGAIQTFLSEASAALTGSKPDVRITPDLAKGRFDLKVEGIISVSAGRLIREIISGERR